MSTLKEYRAQLLVLVLVLLALLLLGGSVLAIRHHQRDREVKQIVDRGSELANESLQRIDALIEQASKRAFSPAQFLTMQDDQRERIDELRREVEKLPPEQQERIRREVGKKFMKQMDKVAADLLEKPKQEQEAILDAFINLMEMSRNDAQGRGRGGMMGGGQGGPGGGPGAQGGPGGQGRAGSPEERERRRREFLDNTTPSERAHFSAALTLLDQRRRQRGLPPMNMGGPR